MLLYSHQLQGRGRNASSQHLYPESLHILSKDRDLRDLEWDLNWGSPNFDTCCLKWVTQQFPFPRKTLLLTQSRILVWLQTLSPHPSPFPCPPTVSCWETASWFHISSAGDTFWLLCRTDASGSHRHLRRTLQTGYWDMEIKHIRSYFATRLLTFYGFTSPESYSGI